MRAIFCIVLAGLCLLPDLACSKEEIGVPLVPVPVTPAVPPLPSSGASGDILEATDRVGGTAIGPEVPPGRSPVLGWSAPDDWLSEPPASPMRIAQWQLPGTFEGESAWCALYHFRGGGTVSQNEARWMSQFEQADGVPTEGRAVRGEMEVNGVAVSTLVVSGTYLGQQAASGDFREPARPGWALFAAVIQTQPPHFLRCLGPEPLLSRQEPAIRAFLGSLRPQPSPP
ncbi:MAG: hypothetical protein JW797_12915 [Bradymonadales bacterium]|nr:hypothetical protein [Bradymonadales bacterium]